MHYNMSSLAPGEHMAATNFFKSKSGTFSEALDVLLIIKLTWFLHHEFMQTQAKQFTRLTKGKCFYITVQELVKSYKVMYHISENDM